MKKRLVSALFLAFACVACGGSDGAPAPSSSIGASTGISEADALAKAEAAAIDQGQTVEGLEVKPSKLFGEYHVSYEPPGSDSLAGGFLVVLDAQTGEFLDLVPYQEISE